MRTILVTGAAGFIGFHLSRRLLAERNEIVGLDNLNPYYDVTLKQSRLKLCTPVSSRQSLTVPPLPSASTCVNHLSEFIYRGLSPHKFTPVSGVLQSFHRIAWKSGSR